jgi:DinB superfamily
MENSQGIIVKCVLDVWNARMKEADKLMNELSDEQLAAEVAPGKNRGSYIFGHLIAVNDRMLPLLGFGSQMYPQLDEPFLFKADRAVEHTPSLAELRNMWAEVNAELAKHMAALSNENWFEKHTSVSEEDFAKEPHRNRLNVILSRSSHLAYHLGQLVLLKR